MPSVPFSNLQFHQCGHHAFNRKSPQMTVLVSLQGQYRLVVSLPLRGLFPSQIHQLTFRNFRYQPSVFTGEHLDYWTAEYLCKQQLSLNLWLQLDSGALPVLRSATIHPVVHLPNLHQQTACQAYPLDDCR